MNEEYLLFSELNKENENLRREVKELTEELMETNTGVLALIQEFEENSKELLINDRLKTEFMEKLKKSNKDQIDRIREQEKALIQADKMVSLGHLVAGVAHEINNPTTYIRSNIELLQKYWKKILAQTEVLENDKFNDYIIDFEETLGSMYKGTGRIMDIVNGLKSFARQDKVIYEVFDLNECISEAYTLVKSEFVRNKINFLDRTVRDKFFINGSRQQLEQVLINLFLNSITAINVIKAQGLGLVEIDVEKTDNNKLILTLKDNGGGIPKENLDLIFNPFFTTNKEFGGTGLGLSIAYGIIKEHGGNVVVRSKENHGTEFLIFLPENHKV
jgi:two-component system, NtrC family, sensor kinase